MLRQKLLSSHAAVMLLESSLLVCNTAPIRSAVRDKTSTWVRTYIQVTTSNCASCSCHRWQRLCSSHLVTESDTPLMFATGSAAHIRLVCGCKPLGWSRGRALLGLLQGRRRDLAQVQRQCCGAHREYFGGNGCGASGVLSSLSPLLQEERAAATLPLAACCLQS